MIYNILISLEIFLLVLVSSFAMYLPFHALVKDKAIALRYAVPLSISIEILIGYIFYSTNTAKYFPLSYLLIAVFANIWAYYKTRPLKLNRLRSALPTLIVLLVALAAIIYTRYFDSFNFIGPGGNDTFNHLKFVKDLIEKGFLSNGYYAPGFHLFLMPVAKIIPAAYLYRFAGPALGIISVISFVLLIKDYLKNKVSLIFFLAILSLPIYNQFSLQTISFFSSSLTFIYFVSFIFLLSDSSNKHRKTYLWLFLIFSSAVALTVPYFFITLIPAFLLVFLIVLICKFSPGEKYSRYLLWVNLILILGLIISFGHVFIQSNVLKRYYGFPGIRTVSEDLAAPNSPDETEVMVSNGELASKYRLPKFITENSFLKPMIGTGIDSLKVKNLRPINSVLGLGAYLWIAFSLYLFGYAIRKKNSALLVVAIFSIFFGLCTQTGMFEMSYYRGRSGWYLLLLSILGLVMFTDQFHLKKLSRWFLVGCVIISATGLFWPPIFYRSYYDAEFKIVSQIAKQFSSRTISLIAVNSQLEIVASNIKMLDFYPKYLVNENAFIVVEKRIFRPNPVLSQSGISTDKNFDGFNKRNEVRSEKLEKKYRQIESDENFKNYKKFFECEDFIVYDNVKEN